MEDNIFVKDTGREKRRQIILGFYKVAIVVGIIAVLVMGVYFQWHNKVYTTYTVTNTIQKIATTDTQYMALDENILIYSKDGISCMDTKGRALWNQTYEMQNPIVKIAGDMVAVGDYNGNIIYIIDGEGAATKIDTNFPIRGLTVSDNGIVSTILEDGDTTWIDTYSKDGNKVAYQKSTMEITGYPIDISFSGQLLAVSFLYVDSGVIKSSVAFYNFGDVGQNSSDKLVSSYTYTDTIVSMIRFLSSNKIFAVGDNRLMFYTGDQKPMHQADQLINEEIQEVFYNDKYVGVLFLDDTGVQKYYLQIYNSNGDKLEKIYFDLDYKDIIFNGDVVVIYTENECVMYDVDGTMKYSGYFESSISAMLPGSRSSKYILLRSSSIEAITLQ